MVYIIQDRYDEAEYGSCSPPATMIMQERAGPNYLKERMPPRPGTFVTTRSLSAGGIILQAKLLSDLCNARRVSAPDLMYSRLYIAGRRPFHGAGCSGRGGAVMLACAKNIQAITLESVEDIMRLV